MDHKRRNSADESKRWRVAMGRRSNKLLNAAAELPRDHLKLINPTARKYMLRWLFSLMCRADSEYQRTLAAWSEHHNPWLLAQMKHIKERMAAIRWLAAKLEYHEGCGRPRKCRDAVQTPSKRT